MIIEEGFSISDVDTEKPENDGGFDAQMRQNVANMRSTFAYMRNRYLRSAEGGVIYNAVLAAYGPKTAEDLATGCRQHFEEYCKNAHLTADGKTTDPQLPTDGRLLRDILRDNRARAYVAAAGDALRISRCLSDDPTTWTRGLLEFYLSNIASRYATQLYYLFENNLEICDVKPTPPHVVSERLSALAADISNLISSLHKQEAGNFVHSDEASGQLRERLLDQLSEGIAAALLFDVPYAIEPKKEDAKPSMVH